MKCKNYWLERVDELLIIHDGTGCRPATDPEIALFEALENQLAYVDSYRHVAAELYQSLEMCGTPDNEISIEEALKEVDVDAKIYLTKGGFVCKRFAEYIGEEKAINHTDPEQTDEFDTDSEGE